jgi:ABC-type lipoprotein export system ATPase subunit
MRPPELLIRQLLVRYADRGDSVTALAIAGCRVPPGTLLAVTGPSGSGKSTLLYAISGLLRPTEGHVLWDGRDIFADGEPARDRWRRRTIGFAFQDFHLLPELTALHNVLLPAGFERFAVPAAIRARAIGLLERFGVPQRRASVGTLSRGEQQRVALARALLFDPPVILADEPTASLDAAAGALVSGWLADLARAEGRTVIAASHDPALIAAADRHLALDHGHASAPEAAGALA